MEPPFFQVTEPTRAFLDYRTDTEREITLPSGTTLHYVRPGGYSDPCSDIYLDWYEFEALGGPWAGEVVVLEDAATPRAEAAAMGLAPHWGYRPILGPSATIRPVNPFPPDWRWARA
jgi:hypothetical protein